MLVLVDGRCLRFVIWAVEAADGGCAFLQKGLAFEVSALLLDVGGQALAELEEFLEGSAGGGEVIWPGRTASAGAEASCVAVGEMRATVAEVAGHRVSRVGPV